MSEPDKPPEPDSNLEPDLKPKAEPVSLSPAGESPVPVPVPVPVPAPASAPPSEAAALAEQVPPPPAPPPEEPPPPSAADAVDPAPSLAHAPTERAPGPSVPALLNRFFRVDLSQTLFDNALAIVLPGAIALFAIVVHHHYPIQQWLFWRYAGFWLLSGAWALGCTAVGHLTIVKLLRRPLRTLEQLTVGFALGVFEFFLLMFVLGCFHLLHPAMFPLVPLAMIGVGIRPFARYVRRWRRHVLYRAPHAPRRTVLGMLPFAFGVMGCVMIYFTLLTPDNAQFDARWKHLALGEDMAVYGGIRRFPEGWTAETNPHLPSFLYGWAFLLPWGSLWSKVELAAHLEFTTFLGTLVGITALVRLLVPKARADWAFAARFLFPGVFLYDSCLSLGADHIAALFVIPTYILLIRCYDKLEPRLCLLLAVMAAGGIQSKLTSLLMLLPVPALVLAVRGLWLSAPKNRGESSERERANWYAGPLTTLAGGLACTAPFWLKNVILYGDPIYPSLHEYLHLRPWTPDGADLFEYGYKEHQFWRPTRDLEGLIKTFGAMFNFSFIPNDYSTYHRDVPVFGSLFTLLLAALPFLRKAKRVWGLALCTHVSLFVWYWTHHQDRYLQTILPWMAAVTAATLTLLWRERRLVRITTGTLVGFQIVWGGDVYFIPGHILIHSPVKAVVDLLGQGYKRDYESRFRTMTPYSDVGKLLPPKSDVLLHDIHPHTGINAISVSDWGGWQFGISYGRMNSPKEVYELLSGMGVTHLLWESSRSQGWDSIAGDLMFYDFVTHHGVKPKQIAHLTLAEMPKAPPAEPFDDSVLYLGCRGEYPPGIYKVGDLRVPVFGPKKNQYPKPREPVGSRSLDELAEKVAFVVVAPKCKKPFPAGARRLFTHVATRRKVGGDQELWVRTGGQAPSRAELPTTPRGVEPPPSPDDDDTPPGM